METRVDLDEVALYKLPHLDLHCLKNFLIFGVFSVKYVILHNLQINAKFAKK